MIQHRHYLIDHSHCNLQHFFIFIFLCLLNYVFFDVSLMTLEYVDFFMIRVNCRSNLGVLAGMMNP